LKRFVSSVFTAALVAGGMAMLSVPAVAQRGGGGGPAPENCPAQPEWQTKSLADYQAALDKANGVTPAPAGGAAAGGRGGGGAAGGRGGGGGGRGGRGGGAQAELPPVPRIPDNPAYGVQAGKPDFGGLAKGVWNVPYIINMATQGRAENGCPVIVPFKPEALALWEDRELGNKEAGDPESFCLPPGVPRMMYTPYPAQIYQMPDRIVMVFEGGAHVWRLIWMDGRKLPNVDDINPDYLGYSVGHWEGDTLVVEAVGFNHQTWLDATGHPHGEQLKVTERYTRTNFNTLQYSATIDDPEYYTAPWTTVINNITWTANTHGPWTLRGGEILEYICQENNRDLSHLGPKSRQVDTR
jgi:hypothetical protein